MLCFSIILKYLSVVRTYINNKIGVMDKIDAIYFSLFIIKKAGSIIFVLSSETSLGSAGEQP
jgi:hypothetical protein